MSRVGKNPVVVPAGVTVDLQGQALKVKGKRGELAFVVHDDVEISRDGANLNFKPRGESRRARAMQVILPALQQTAFFPLMTTAIRPLGEVLTLLPVHADKPTPTAGASFKFTRNLTLHPHRRAAWQVMLLQLEQLAADALRLCELPAYPEPVRGRLELVYENAARMALNFSGAMNLPPPT